MRAPPRSGRGKRGAGRHRAGKADLVLDAELLREPLELGLVRPGADDDGGRGIDGALRGKRREHDVDALERPKLADKDEVRRIVGQHRLVEFMRIKPVRHDAHRAGRRTDELAEAARCKQAFEDEAVGERRKPLLRPDIDAPGESGRRVVQAAAMRRVERADAWRLRLSPRAASRA